MKQSFVTTQLLIFTLLTAGFYFLNATLPEYSFLALEGANLIIFLLMMVGFMIVKKQMNQSGGAFVRGVSAATMLKMFVCMIAAAVYIKLNSKHLHKPTLFLMMGIYAIYLVSETLMLSKVAKERKE